MPLEAQSWWVERSGPYAVPQAWMLGHEAFKTILTFTLFYFIGDGRATSYTWMLEDNPRESEILLPSRVLEIKPRLRLGNNHLAGTGYYVDGTEHSKVGLGDMTSSMGDCMRERPQKARQHCLS